MRRALRSAATRTAIRSVRFARPCSPVFRTAFKAVSPASLAVLQTSSLAFPALSWAQAFCPLCAQRYCALLQRVLRVHQPLAALVQDFDAAAASPPSPAGPADGRILSVVFIHALQTLLRRYRRFALRPQRCTPTLLLRCAAELSPTADLLCVAPPLRSQLGARPAAPVPAPHGLRRRLPRLLGPRPRLLPRRTRDSAVRPAGSCSLETPASAPSASARGSLPRGPPTTRAERGKRRRTPRTHRKRTKTRRLRALEWRRIRETGETGEPRTRGSKSASSRRNFEPKRRGKRPEKRPEARFRKSF